MTTPWKARSPEAVTGLDGGFMACAGLYYRKSFTVEPEIIGQRFWLEFEGHCRHYRGLAERKADCQAQQPHTGLGWR